MNRAVDPDFIHGVTEIESTDRGMRLHRLPSWVRRQYSDPQLLSMETQPSGVHLIIRTSARTLDLTTHSARIAYRGARRARGSIDVIVNGELFARETLSGGDVTEIDFRTMERASSAGPPHTTTITGLPVGENEIQMWLPHNESVELLSLESDAPLFPRSGHGQRWVHHGSSISQGSNAVNPSRIWPAVAARIAGAQLNNLGFGGSALVDPFMARVIRDTPADVISLKLGINVVNTDAMRLRAFVPAVHGFLDTIRDGHPHTPIVVVSPIFCGIHESTPGPGRVDISTLGTDDVQFVATGDPDEIDQGKLTLQIIRKELHTLISRRSTDTNLHYLDGLDLFGPRDALELPLPDGLHPNADAHLCIGERFAAYAFGKDGPFADEHPTRNRRPLQR